MSSNEVLRVMSEHRSIRKFTTEEVTEETVKDITDAARWAATSHHVQAYSVIAVRNKERKAKLAELTGGQRWVDECPVFFVICGDFTRQERASELHGEGFDVGGAEQLIVASVDAALLAQNMLLAAESLSLGGVMIGGIRNNPGEVCEVLNLPKYVFPVMGMAIGHPDQDPGQKPRLPHRAAVHEETYNHQQETDLMRYDKETHEYYVERTNNKRQTTWSEMMASYTGVRKRPHMDAFLKEQGFLHEESRRSLKGT
ncbi:oxygen-insensitive NADPH nitroreductase [Shouchella shacheensis]|uniref:oxygen-insensitive NADPH nitroreductase n=1 Tax=Shouchella shacheensis TaxID=1649580 RepID=UPI0009E67905|nr:oxygen-insensitive NADPH nitroreductase [Shouchella shacheensis]